MSENKILVSPQNVLGFFRLSRQYQDEELCEILTQGMNVANQLLDILYSLAECQPHQFSSLKLRAQELITSLEN